MKQPIFIANTDIDEKRIGFIERVVSRLVRRAKSSIKVIQSPYPMICTGPMSCMFPSNGVWNKMVVKLLKAPKGGATVVCKVDATAEMYTRYPVKELFIEEVNMNVKVGNLVRAWVEPVVEGEEVGEYFISLLWTPTIKEGTIRKFLIDDLEEGIDAKEQA